MKTFTNLFNTVVKYIVSSVKSLWRAMTSDTVKTTTAGLGEALICTVLLVGSPIIFAASLVLPFVVTIPMFATTTTTLVIVVGTITLMIIGLKTAWSMFWVVAEWLAAPQQQQQ